MSFISFYPEDDPTGLVKNMDLFSAIMDAKNLGANLARLEFVSALCNLIKIFQDFVQNSSPFLKSFTTIVYAVCDSLGKNL